MKKILISSILFLSCLVLTGNPVNKIKLDNGLTLGVEVCQDGIFHVNISPRDSFSESLMIRYGVVKSDWEAVDHTFTQDAESYHFSTPKGSISVSKATGAICLRDASGAALVRELVFVGPGSGRVKSLADAIVDKFGSMVVAKNNGIIGDDENSKGKKDSECPK